MKKKAISLILSILAASLIPPVPFCDFTSQASTGSVPSSPQPLRAAFDAALGASLGATLDMALGQPFASLDTASGPANIDPQYHALQDHALQGMAPWDRQQAFPPSLPDEETASDQSIPQDGIYTVMLDSATGPFTYYNQGDRRWRDYKYGDSQDTLGQYGCGPTVMAMLITSLTGNLALPTDLCDWSAKNGCWCQASGSYHSLIRKSAKAYGLKAEPFRDYRPQALVDSINGGHLLVALMKKGHFTKHGHFIILIGTTPEGKIRVADSANYQNCTLDWDPKLIIAELNTRAKSGGPLWAISPP